jgi:hypothetical protein
MHRRQRTIFIILTAMFFLAGACAKVSSPSGGPRDRQPPVVMKCVPENETINFHDKSISITFDEYVVLDNVNEKFMVSPPLEKKPRIFIKGKSVNVEFEEELRDSTTYTFYFQDAIKDLNEGNIIENYQFVFSTGPVIDSLSVTGNVFKSFDLEVPEKTMVLMYRNLDDTAVMKSLPDYISRVGENGYFRIDNVRSGRYRLYALTDVDNSKNYNLRDEEFAFMNSPVDITPEKNYFPVITDTSTIAEDLNKIPIPPVLKGEYQLLLFVAEKKDHYLTGSSRDTRYHMSYTLSLPPDTMDFEFLIPGTNNNAYFTEMSRYRDTLQVWITDSSLYSQQQIETIIDYPFTDTLDVLGYKEDTILMRFIEPRAPRSGQVRPPAFKFGTNIPGGSLKPGQQVVFNSQTPFRQPDMTRIEFLDVSDSISTKVPYSFVKDSINSRKLLLEAALVPGKRYLFIADSASFGNIYGENCDSTALKLTVRDPESFNKLTFNLKNNEGKLIIQLLNKTEKLLSKKGIANTGTLEFSLLEPGFYRVRSIYDLNGDDNWTTGDFSKGLQPEPVSYYPTEIEIKPGWDLDQDWDLKIKNYKDQKLRTKKTTGR